MKKLFVRKSDDEKRTKRTPILWTDNEHLKVTNSAKIRNLEFSEFVRRASLGRKADVDFDTQTVLALHHVVQEIRRFRKDFLGIGLAPPDKELLLVLDQAGEAFSRIQK